MVYLFHQASNENPGETINRSFELLSSSLITRTLDPYIGAEGQVQSRSLNSGFSIDRDFWPAILSASFIFVMLRGVVYLLVARKLRQKM